MIDRGDYWQCAYVIPKGGIDAVQRRGLERSATTSPTRAVRSPTGSASSRLGRRQAADASRSIACDGGHRPGLLCIGDAAHAMSPVGGVGINLAIQDAVAAANILAATLRAGRSRTTISIASAGAGYFRSSSPRRCRSRFRTEC